MSQKGICAYNYVMQSESNDNSENNSAGFTDLDVNLDVLTKEPSLYRVLLHNDDYTPMDFVTFVLKRFFSKSEEAAQKIMLDVHHKGVGLAGVFSFEIAETKVMQVNQFSKQNQYPLKTSFEPEKDE